MLEHRTHHILGLCGSECLASFPTLNTHTTTTLWLFTNSVSCPDIKRTVMKISDLAYALISAATKGANVASIIRSEDTLLQLLTEEKTGDQKNERFVQDFKTLADVLIQEMVRHDLDRKFPGLGENLYGEESSEFTNAIGETVNVEIKPSQQENYELLCKSNLF
ncbi:INPP1 [Acanthosepion pharaonis]|uniref:INPP1 n=1 Tax=Acanthosepion pharaonis TaxID=158019 RepID=A0A812CEA9_ACAPH|nr:INPP1 [Sepia pharaonis]